MNKIIILLGIVLMSGMFFSCSTDEDISAYVEELEIQNIGGEDGDLDPPPPPPPVTKP